MPENISLKVLILSLDIPFYFKFKTITLTLRTTKIHVKPLKILGDQHCYKHFHSRPIYLVKHSYTVINRTSLRQTGASHTTFFWISPG